MSGEVGFCLTTSLQVPVKLNKADVPSAPDFPLEGNTS